MSATYFITGLCRSRTAWLANAMTYAGSFCHHDLTHTASDWAEFQKVMQQPYEFVGDSDSGLLSCFRQVDAFFPSAKWVLVERNPEACFRSAEAFFGITLNDQARAVMLHWLAEFEEFVQAKDHITVEFDGFDEKAMKKLWDFTTDSSPFWSGRFTMLQRFIVNVQKECYEVGNTSSDEN